MKVDIEFLAIGIHNEGYVQPGTHVICHLNVEGAPSDSKYITIFSGDINNEGKVIFYGDSTHPVHWTSLPKTTRVGWYGPMMKWSKLEEYTDTLRWD